MSFENRVAGNEQDGVFANNEFQSLPEYQVYDTNGHYQIR